MEAEQHLINILHHTFISVQNKKNPDLFNQCPHHKNAVILINPYCVGIVFYIMSSSVAVVDVKMWPISVKCNVNLM